MAWTDAEQPKEGKSERKKEQSIKLPPSDEDSEKAVLGCILMEAKLCLPQAVTELPGPIAFYKLAHANLYEQMLIHAQDNPGLDILTITGHLKALNKTDDCGGVAYFTALPDQLASVANFPSYLQRVKDCFALRNIIQQSTEIIQRAYAFSDGGNLNECLDAIEAELLSISRLRVSSEERSMKVLINKNIETLEDLSKNPGKMMGLPTGFADLDKMTRGMEPGGMWVIGARPSNGKTSLSLNIADYVATELKVPVGIFSFEMLDEQLSMRMLCSRARVNMRNMQDGFITERDFPKLTGAAGKLAKAPIMICDKALNDMTLRSKARMYFEQGCRLFIIDYFQKMQGHKKKYGTRAEELSAISSAIKSVAMELKCPFLVLAQLSREFVKLGKKPKISDLKECGRLEEDGDFVGLLYRNTDDDEDDDPAGNIWQMCLDIGKQRNGPTGRVYLNFIRDITRFESAAKITTEDQRKMNL